MSVKITQPIPPNVVEIGNEITQAVVDGLMSASPSPSSSNPYATQSLLNDKLSLSGGTMTGQITIDGDSLLITNGNYVDFPDHWSSLGINYSGISCGGDQDGFSLSGGGLTFNSSEFTSFNPNGVTFPDNTIQTTAATTPNLTPYLQKSDNLASLTSVSTARTNLGLTSLATASFATTSEAQAGTSASTVINPLVLFDAKIFAGYKPLSLVYTWTSATSGTGASTTASGQTKNVFAPTSTTGYAQIYIFNYNSSRGIASAIGADFTKRTIIGGRFVKTVTTADANSVFRFLLGKYIPTPLAGDLSARGIGFRQVANGALELQVHNGTTLYNVTSSFTPTANQTYDVVIVSDGGTATMYVNGSSVATSANAPTAILTTNLGILEVEAQNTSILSGSPMSYSCSDMFVNTNL